MTAHTNENNLFAVIDDILRKKATRCEGRCPACGEPMTTLHWHAISQTGHDTSAWGCHPCFAVHHIYENGPWAGYPVPIEDLPSAKSLCDETKRLQIENAWLKREIGQLEDLALSPMDEVPF